MIKRLFDVVFAACVLMIAWPLILIGSLAAKLTSPGPAFYRAKRAGLGRKPFDMLKLRTMYVGADTPNRRVTAERDERITPVGAFLRKLKLDELPQFWNILRGEMSIVGPRPEDWDIVEGYYTPEQRRVLKVRPGIAALADVRLVPGPDLSRPATGRCAHTGMVSQSTHARPGGRRAALRGTAESAVRLENTGANGLLCIGTLVAKFASDSTF